MPTSRLLLLLLASGSLEPVLCQMRVRLYDYAGVPPRTLAQAKSVASEVLETASVRVTWADCPSPACSGPTNPGSLQVRILSKAMAKLVPHVSRKCMGYAVLAGEFSTIASVFYHRAVDLEDENLAGRAEILGAMLAHEIGHLLLGRPSHSNTGIMRGVWSDQDLKNIVRGRMWFTARDAKLLVANTQARIGASRAERSADQ